MSLFPTTVGFVSFQAELKLRHIPQRQILNQPLNVGSKFLHLITEEQDSKCSVISRGPWTFTSEETS